MAQLEGFIWNKQDAVAPKRTLAGTPHFHFKI